MACRVVLDTNVFVAAYWNRYSASARILRACRQGQIRACISDEVEREVRLVLRTIRAGSDFYADAVEMLLSAERVAPSVHVRVIEEDPEDNKLLSCAAAARADYLISADRHLLSLGKYGDTVILPPARFAEQELAANGGNDGGYARP